MRSRAWPHLLGVVAVVFAASLLLAGAFPLLDPDEGRNAEVAREMAADGDLVVPHLAGMPYLDKPPALFWGAAAAIRFPRQRCSIARRKNSPSPSTVVEAASAARPNFRGRASCCFSCASTHARERASRVTWCS